MFLQVSDIMHALFGTHKEAALPFFEQLLPDFHSLILVSGKSLNYHQCVNLTAWHLNSLFLSRSFSVQRSTARCIDVHCPVYRVYFVIQTNSCTVAFVAFCG